MQPSETVAADPYADRREFLQKYWTALTTGDIDAFAPMVAENCVVHYPGNHFLSGDYVGRAAILDLYRKLYKVGIEQGTFVGEFHDGLHSDDHTVALVTYSMELGMGQRLIGQAVGVFHIENGQMAEYWLLERDQKMVNDIVRMSGKAALAGGSKGQLALGVLKHPIAAINTARRVIRQRRGAQKML